MYTHQQALAVADDVALGYGQAYTDSELRSAIATILRATGDLDVNSNDASWAAYLTIGRHERARRTLDGRTRTPA